MSSRHPARDKSLWFANTQKFFKRRGEVIGWSVGAVGVVIALSAGIYIPFRIHANDYAHIDPGSVMNSASEVLLKHYGDRVPSNLKFVSKEKSHFFGKRAWKVVYKNPQNELICPYIWQTDNGNYETKDRILQGTACQ